MAGEEDGEGGEGGGFGAEDEGAEGDALPGGVLSGFAFARVPAAFGAAEEGGGGGGVRQDGEDRRRVFRLVEKEAGFGLGVQGLFELDHGADFRGAQAARLLAGFAGDLFPARAALFGGRVQSFLRSQADDRGDAFDAEFGGFLDHPFETVELEQRGQKVDGSMPADGRELFHQSEFDGLLAEGLNARQPEVFAVGEFVELSAFGSEDPAEVLGGFAAEEGLSGLPFLGVEQAAGHSHSE